MSAAVGMELAKKALFDAAVSVLGATAVEYPNVAFTPPTGAKFAKLFCKTNEPVVNTMGATGEDRISGFMQVTMSYPIGTGDAAAFADYSTFRASFKAGGSVTSGGQVVKITGCGHSIAGEGPKYYTAYITVYFYTLLQRS